ncbi:MAG TPA: hypothetical protein VK168_10490 [Saprospiraceae bacterium]|nr:hypothetical protein [Saprospiraceae bacterium]
MSFNNLFSGAYRHRRIAGIVYLIQFALAVTLGMQVHGVLEASIGHSLELNRLLAGYDHTVMTDFLKVHGASITPLIGQLRWLMLVWLFFAIFLHGGMLYGAVQEKVTAGNFWIGGSRFFLRFLGFSAVFLGIALVWAGLIWAPVLSNLQSMLTDNYTETYAVWTVVASFVVFMLGLSCLYLWSIAGRIHLIQADGKVWLSLRAGLRWAFRNKGYLSGLFAVFALCQVLLILAYWALDAWLGMRSAAGIACMFVAQQVFVYLRIMFQAGLYQTIATPMLSPGA